MYICEYISAHAIAPTTGITLPRSLSASALAPPEPSPDLTAQPTTANMPPAL